MRILFNIVVALWLLVSPVLAAGMPLILQDGRGGTGASSLQANFVGTATSTHSGAVGTYTNANIGPTAGYTTRRIIFVIYTNNLSGPSATNPISSFTINGSAPVNGAICTQQSQGGSGTPFAAILSADIATGTQATIAITYNSSVFNDPNMAIYGADDALMVSTSCVTPTPGTATAATTVSTGSYSQTNGGFTIAAVGQSTAVTGLSFNGGLALDSNTGAAAAAHANGVGPTGSVVTTANWTTSANAALVAATWH
jgi:hypothetical protein